MEPQIKTYLSNWQIEKRCVSCKTALSEEQIWGNEGMCPLCAKRSHWSNIKVDTTEHPYRLVRDGKWWQFWIKPYREYKE